MKTDIIVTVKERIGYCCLVDSDGCVVCDGTEKEQLFNYVDRHNRNEDRNPFRHRIVIRNKNNPTQ